MKKFLNSIVAVCVGLMASAQAFAVAALTPLNDALFRYQAKTGLIACMDAVPSNYDFNSRRVTNAAQSEVIRQRFYDFLLYPAAGVNQLSFFSQPIGQGVTTALGAAVGSAKTPFDTNLVLQNTLPSGAGYMIESIEVLFTPGSSLAANTYLPAALAQFNAIASATIFAQVNDVNIFYQSGMLELNILAKNYLRETPLLTFPPKSHLDVVSGIASNSATTSTIGLAFAKAAGRPYYIDPEISLQAAVNFDVTLKWPQPLAMPSTFNGRVGVFLDGFTMRASQ